MQKQNINISSSSGKNTEWKIEKIATNVVLVTKKKKKKNQIPR